MKLSRLEKKILVFVRDCYPVPWDESETNAIIAIGERPIPTRDEIARKFQPTPETQVNNSLDKLIEFRLVRTVHLWHRDDFSELVLGPGPPLRQPNSAKGKGGKGHQITTAAEKEIENFPLVRVKSIGIHAATEFIKKHGAMIVLAAIASLLLLFGINLYRWIPGLNPARPAQAPASRPAN